MSAADAVSDRVYKRGDAVQSASGRTPVYRRAVDRVYESDSTELQSVLGAPNRHLPKNDSSLNGDVSMGDNLGSLIYMNPKPVAS